MGSGSPIVNLSALGRATNSQPCTTSIPYNRKEGSLGGTYASPGTGASVVVRGFLVARGAAITINDMPFCEPSVTRRITPVAVPAAVHFL